MDLKNLTEGFNKTIKHLQDEFMNIRASGAHPSMLSSVMVSSYGAMVPISNLASIMVQGGTSIVVTPFDKSNIKEIIIALAKSNTGLNGIEEGDKIRVPVPSLTTEKREHFSKEAKEKAEKAKVAIRNIRQDFLNKIKNDKSLREDESKKLTENVQKEVDKANKEVDNILKTKIDSLMKI